MKKAPDKCKNCEFNNIRICGVDFCALPRCVKIKNSAEKEEKKSEQPQEVFRE